jgi:hypothetical protein
VAHGLAGEQQPDDVDALPQPRLPHLLARPGVAGDVLVEVLAGPERRPEPAGVHRRERRHRLRRDRRVVALARRRHHAERQRRRLQRGAQPGERERRLSLPLAPREEVVGAHGRGETGVLGGPDGRQERGGVHLLVGGVEADDGHTGCLPAVREIRPRT